METILLSGDISQLNPNMPAFVYFIYLFFCVCVFVCVCVCERERESVFRIGSHSTGAFLKIVCLGQLEINSLLPFLKIKTFSCLNIFWYFYLFLYFFIFLN